MPKSQLADLANVTPTAIGNYCNGRVPKSDELYRIATVFGVSMEELLTGQPGPRGGAADSVWKLKAEHAEQKLSAIKGALGTLLKKI